MTVSIPTLSAATLRPVLGAGPVAGVAPVRNPFGAPRGGRGALRQRPRLQELPQQTGPVRGFRRRRSLHLTAESHGAAALAEQERKRELGLDLPPDAPQPSGVAFAFEWLGRLRPVRPSIPTAHGGEPGGRREPRTLHAALTVPSEVTSWSTAWNFESGGYPRWVAQHLVPRHPTMQLRLFGVAGHGFAAPSLVKLLPDREEHPPQQANGEERMPVGDTMKSLLRFVGGWRLGIRELLHRSSELLCGRASMRGCWFHQNSLHAVGANPWRGGTANGGRFFGWVLP